MAWDHAGFIGGFGLNFRTCGITPAACQIGAESISDAALRDRDGDERARHFPRNALDGAMADADFVRHFQDALNSY